MRKFFNFGRSLALVGASMLLFGFLGFGDQDVSGRLSVGQNATVLGTLHSAANTPSCLTNDAGLCDVLIPLAGPSCNQQVQVACSGLVNTCFSTGTVVDAGGGTCPGPNQITHLKSSGNTGTSGIDTVTAVGL